jgi:DNA-directed RNA polymerase subunit RPC12/RpoP
MKFSKLNVIRGSFLALVLGALVLVVLERSIEGFAVIGVCAIALLFMVREHARRAAYVCPRCGSQFKISALKDFVSPHKGYEKWLQCPQCAASDWCREV